MCTTMPTTAQCFVLTANANQIILGWLAGWLSPLPTIKTVYDTETSTPNPRPATHLRHTARDVSHSTG